jgi:dynein heavy chain 2
MMRQLQADWGVVCDRIVKVQRDCKHFGRDMPTMSYYDKMKDELEEQKQMWGYFEEFKAGTDEFRKEEWLTFRKREFFKFQDFFLKYQEFLATVTKSVVTRFILSLIDGYKQAWPLVKLCAGEAFEKIHWRQLIGMLQMDKEVTFDNMIFGNLIDAVPVMLKKSKEMKELADRAQGEVTIREAINELAVWCENTEFELFELESNGRTTSIVKEWKEIMTGISDKQSLIISLKESRHIKSFAE